MEYRIHGQEILITVPASNDGKFRFKKRSDPCSFGKSFSTRELCFDAQTYLEWQIGYDVPVADVKKGEKQTRLTRRSFTGSNGKEKYPSELSEIFYSAMKAGLIDPKETERLVSEIKNYKSFVDEKEISVERLAGVTINKTAFEETQIKLPTFFTAGSADGTQIEVSIQKQQYASGVQPMIYFCIPFTSFRDHKYLLGHSSVPGNELTYGIDKKNVQNMVHLMKVFGMASRRHQHDVIQILQVLLGLI